MRLRYLVPLILLVAALLAVLVSPPCVGDLAHLCPPIVVELS